MPLDLSAVEVRVLGSLVEKAQATPEYYPLSLNALVNACNQKTQREPVMDLGEDDVARALSRLQRLGFVGTTTGEGSRVTKYRHLLGPRFNLDEPKLSALALLLLRGPQTAGEVRSRAGRLYAFESVEQVEEALDALARREEPLTVRLPVQPGQSAARYLHLLEEGVDAETFAQQIGPVRAAPLDDHRLDRLEQEVTELKAELAALRTAFETFRDSLGG